QKWIIEGTTKDITKYYPQNNTSTDNSPMYLFLAVLITGILFRFRKNIRTNTINIESWFDVEEEVKVTPKRRKEYLTYFGDELNFSDEVLTAVLTKQSHFFNTLGDLGKQRFLLRLKKFIEIKVFNIHDTSGFKEMPILISAAAIQLS